MSEKEFGFGAGDSYAQDVQPNVSFSEPAGAPVKDISTAEFAAEVINASQEQPVLVDFWAPWCGPCKQLAPALEKAVAATRGKVKLVKMDIDKHPEVAGQMGIQSIPAVVAFVKGRPADAFMGAKPEGEIREFIAKIAGPDDQQQQIEMALEQAAGLASEGAVADALQLYGQILSLDPENTIAIAAVGQLYLDQKNVEGAKGLVANLSDEKRGSAEIASLLSAIDLAEQAENVGDFAELQNEVAANPTDHAKRLELAIAMNGAGLREEAADHLLEIIRKEPEWNENAAREQLLQFFEAWGLTDETTLSSRRKLSSILFS